jgi:hypothetical protein
MNVIQTMQYFSVILEVHDGNILLFDREGYECIHG